MRGVIDIYLIYSNMFQLERNNEFILFMRMKLCNLISFHFNKIVYVTDITSKYHYVNTKLVYVTAKIGK